MELTPAQWIQVVAFGALFGAIGQAIRVIPGIKKLSDEAARGGQHVADLFSGSQMFVSLLIGAVAGALGVIGLGIKPEAVTKSDTLMTLLGIGYAGADFIEAFMRRAAPQIGNKDSVIPEATKPGSGGPQPAASSTNGTNAEKPKAVG